MRQRTNADDIVQRTYNRTILDLILPGIISKCSDFGCNVYLYPDLTITIFISILQKYQTDNFDIGLLINALQECINRTGIWCIEDTSFQCRKLDSQNVRLFIIHCGGSKVFLKLNILKY